MSKGSNGNEGSSGEPSKTRPHSASEAEYLDRQAQNARNAMNQVVEQIKGLARDASDPRPYVEQYPWISMGAAAVAGFLAGTTLTPARGQRIGERLSSLMPAGSAGGKQKSPLRFITTPLLRMARTALVSAITGAAAAKAATSETQEPASPPVPRPAKPYTGPPVAEGGAAFVSAGGGTVPQESPRQQSTTP